MTLTLPNIFLLDLNFEKSIIGLYFLLISFMLPKFAEHKKLIVMSLIKMFKFQDFLIKHYT